MLVQAWGGVWGVESSASSAKLEELRRRVGGSRVLGGAKALLGWAPILEPR